MTIPVWQVKVYDSEGKNYDLYHFKHKSDVLSSITATWENDSLAIRYERTESDNKCILVTYANNRRVAVCAELIHFELLSKPTKF